MMQTIQINVRIPRNWRPKLQKIATKERRASGAKATVSDVIRRLIAVEVARVFGDPV
jgi:hypothetical protein